VPHPIDIRVRIVTDASVLHLTQVSRRWAQGAGGACLRLPRCGPRGEAVLRPSRRLRGSPARRSIVGKADLDVQPLPKGRVRRAGGGRRSVCENDPGLVPALKRLVEPATLGDPMRPLIWVSKSMEKLAATLTEMGHPISADTVRTELVKLGFSRQSNSQGG
jgi:hypothetical protein